MFTYDENCNFSGFWFYNDNSSYTVNDKGEIISNSNSENFNLKSGTFVRRIGLNEGETGETQSEKNEKRIVYIGEIVETTVTIDTTISTLYYNSDTLIITKSDNNPELVGKYYVEFNDSKNIKTQLIVEINKENINNSGIIKQIGSSTIIYSINDVEFNNPRVNFNIKDGTNKIVYVYRSRDIKDEEFMNKMFMGIMVLENTRLLAVHLAPGVKKIGNSAFQNCETLTQVEIPNSVTEIGDDAFASCTGLIQVTIRGTLTSVERYAFKTNGSTTLIIRCNETTKNKITEAINGAYKVDIQPLENSN